MSAQMQEQQEHDDLPPEDAARRSEAIKMGWNPDPSKHHGKSEWVDYNEYLERGEKILPLVKAHSEVLKKENLTLQAKVASLEAAVQESQKAVKALQKNFTEATEHRVQEARKELKAQIREAKLAGDVQTELKLLDALETLQEQQAAAERKPPEAEAPKPQQPADEPWAQEWFKENPWFGSPDLENIDKTAHMQRIGYRLKNPRSPLYDPTLVGKSFMDECKRIMEEERDEEAGGTPTRRSKVAGSDNSRSTPSKRAFDNLPADVKKACNEQASDFVGDRKPFKDLAAWQDHFAKTYLES